MLGNVDYGYWNLPLCLRFLKFTIINAIVRHLEEQ